MIARQTQAEARGIALGAVRAEIRHAGGRAHELDPDQALRVLDDLLRREPDLVASRWYGEASENQIRLFRREWRRWAAGVLAW